MEQPGAWHRRYSLPCTTKISGGAFLTTAQEDEIIQRSVFTEALVLYPAQLTILELALRVETDRRSCEQDAIERAVRELARDGLILCDCRRLSPSRAAVRFDELLGGVS